MSSDTLRPAAPGRDLPPLPPSRQRDQAIWVGFFLVLGIMAVLAALYILTDAAIFRGRYIVTTSVDDAGGIRKGDPVQMRGVNIGRVQRFSIGPQGVDIRLELEKEYEIPKDSQVELQSSGLLGGMVAEVVPGTSKEVLRGGDRVPGRREPGTMDAANKIAVQAETVLSRVETLLSDATIKNVSDTTRNVEAGSRDLQRLLDQVSAAVAEQRRELKTLSLTLRRSADGLEKVATAPELDRTIKRLDTLTQRMDTVTETLDRTSRSMETVMGRIERGEGTLGKMAKDEDLYRNLNQAALNINQASVNINKLTEEVRRDPRKYLKLSVF